MVYGGSLLQVMVDGGSLLQVMLDGGSLPAKEQTCQKRRDSTCCEVLPSPLLQPACNILLAAMTSPYLSARSRLPQTASCPKCMGSTCALRLGSGQLTKERGLAATGHLVW